MCAHVFSQAATLSEALVTDITLVGLLPRVCAHVCCQVAALREPLAADVALVLFVPTEDIDAMFVVVIVVVIIVMATVIVASIVVLTLIHPAVALVLVKFNMCKCALFYVHQIDALLLQPGEPLVAQNTQKLCAVGKLRANFPIRTLILSTSGDSL